MRPGDSQKIVSFLKNKLRGNLIMLSGNLNTFYLLEFDALPPNWAQ